MIPYPSNCQALRYCSVWVCIFICLCYFCFTSLTVGGVVPHPVCVHVHPIRSMDSHARPTRPSIPSSSQLQRPRSLCLWPLHSLDFPVRPYGDVCVASCTVRTASQSTLSLRAHYTAIQRTTPPTSPSYLSAVAFLSTPQQPHPSDS